MIPAIPIGPITTKTRMYVVVGEWRDGGDHTHMQILALSGTRGEAEEEMKQLKEWAYKRTGLKISVGMVVGASEVRRMYRVRA